MDIIDGGTHLFLWVNSTKTVKTEIKRYENLTGKQFELSLIIN